MNERRRIIIPIGANPDEPLSTPHFDTDATLTARPVVPLSDQETSQIHYGVYQGNDSKPFWKRPALLALVVVIAVGAGVAAGFAISIYRNRQATTPPVANSPGSAGESANTGPMVEQPAPSQAPAVVAGAPAETPVRPKDEDRESTASNEPNGDNDVSLPVVRDKKPETTNDDSDPVLEERQAERERRREERRERRRRQSAEDEVIDVPRRIGRAGREINGRIREIFEGRQP